MIKKINHLLFNMYSYIKNKSFNMSKTKEILEKIKGLFTETPLEIPAETPQEPAETEVNMGDRLNQLEERIKLIDELLTTKEKALKETEEKIETLSKQITEKDEKIKSLEVELSQTPASEPIQVEKKTKKTTFAEQMHDKIKSERTERGLSY
jgi:chromosome segregation ATPase